MKEGISRQRHRLNRRKSRQSCFNCTSNPWIMYLFVIYNWNTVVRFSLSFVKSFFQLLLQSPKVKGISSNCKVNGFNDFQLQLMLKIVYNVWQKDFFNLWLSITLQKTKINLTCKVQFITKMMYQMRYDLQRESSLHFQVIF